MESDTRRPVIMPAPISSTLGSNTSPVIWPRGMGLSHCGKLSASGMNSRRCSFSSHTWGRPQWPELLGQRAVGAQQPHQPARHQRDDQRVGLLHRFRPLGVQAAERLGGGDAAGELQLLLIHHLALHRDGQKDAQRGREHGKGGDDIPGPMHAFDQQQRAEGRGDRVARGIAGGRRGGLHAVVFEDGHLAQPAARKRAQWHSRSQRTARTP